MIFRISILLIIFCLSACKPEPEIILQKHHQGAELKIDDVTIIFEDLSCEHRCHSSVKIFDSEAMDTGPYGLIIQVEGTSRPAKDGQPEIGTSYWSGGVGGQRGEIKIGSHKIILMEKGSLLSINGNEFKITESDELTFVVTEDNKNEVTILPSDN